MTTPRAIHAIQRVAVEAAAGTRAQLSLDIVGEVLLRPLVVITAAGHAHRVSPSRLRAGTAVVTVVDHPRAGSGRGGQPVGPGREAPPSSCSPPAVAGSKASEQELMQ